MTTRNTLSLVALLALALTLGCEVPELEIVEAAPAPRPVAVVVEEPAEEEAFDDGQPPVTSVPREVTPNDPTKGKKSRQAGGALGAAGHARFYIEHKLIFDSIKHALDIQWGLDGEYPQSNDEFMEKIVNFNGIKLPELDEGVEYIYDPEDHLLKIYRPDAAPEPEDSSDPSDRG